MEEGRGGGSIWISRLLPQNFKEIMEKLRIERCRYFSVLK